MAIGQHLKSLRKSADLTQEELAEASGVPRHMIAQYETDRRNIQPDDFTRLCEALGVSPEALAQHAEPDSPVGRVYGRPYTVPVVGVVSAGDGRDEPYDPPERLAVSQMFPANSVVAYRVVGESMVDSHIMPGDYVIVRPDPQPGLGEVVVVFVPDHGTLVKIKRKSHYAPSNATQGREPIPITDECREFGALVGVIRQVQPTPTKAKRGRAKPFPPQGG